MEKYIAMWNVTSRTYIARVGQESKRLGGQDAAAFAAMATGSPEGSNGGLS
jgi:import inner membrane translocase subunit TIM13